MSPWPTPWELQHLVVDGPEPGRVLLGRLATGTYTGGGWLTVGRAAGAPALASEPCRHVMVIGTTRSGKTRSLLAPAVLHWSGPVVTTSIRDDVLALTQRQRRAAGWPILVYNPKLEGRFGSSTWSPLVPVMHSKDQWVAALRTADLLVEAADLATTAEGHKHDFWNAAAAQYLAPVLLAAAQLGPSMRPVMRWLHTADEFERDAEGNPFSRTRDEIRGLLDKKFPAALQTVNGVWKLHDKLRSSIYLTARTALGAYQDDDVLSTCGEKGELADIRPETVLGTETDPGATLYLISPPTNRRYFAPLFVALLTSLLDAVYSRSESGRGMDPPLLLALDEVANIAPIPELPFYSGTAAGAGMQLVTVLQDLAQADNIWGESNADTLLTNHWAKLIFGGGTGVKTLNWVQQMYGEVEMVHLSESRGKGGRSMTADLQRRPLLSIDEIRRVPIGGALLVYGRDRATIVTLKQHTTI